MKTQESQHDICLSSAPRARENYSNMFEPKNPPIQCHAVLFFDVAALIDKLSLAEKGRSVVCLRQVNRQALRETGTEMIACTVASPCSSETPGVTMPVTSRCPF